MSQAYKICPICDTPNHRNAALCSTCGTTLVNVPVVNTASTSENSGSDYAELHGETDLLEGNLHWRGGTYVVGGLVTLVLLGCIGTLIFAGSRFFSAILPATAIQPTAVSRTLTLPADVFGGTNTPRITMLVG